MRKYNALGVPCTFVGLNFVVLVLNKHCVGKRAFKFLLKTKLHVGVSHKENGTETVPPKTEKAVFSQK